MEPQYGGDYRLVWATKRTRLIAEVRNYAHDRSAYRVVKVIHDDDNVKKVNMRYLAVGWVNKEPEVIVSDEFLRLPRLLQEAAIWHEAGHVHHEHHFKRSIESQKQQRLLRIQYINSGVVMPEEAEADKFAVERLGRAPLVEFLNLLIQTRPIGAVGGLNELGRTELELRVKNIHEMKA